MKVFFMPHVSENFNTGPATVDRKLVEHWPAGEQVVSSQYHGWRHAREIVSKSLASDCVVADGWGRLQEIVQHICRLFGKGFVCITHGWLPYENEVNKLGFSENDMKRCERFMGRCDAVVAVSRMQAKFEERQLQGARGKIGYFFNGVERRMSVQHRSSGHLIVSVSGGTRPIKRNEAVADACTILASRGIDIELKVYGRDYAGDSSWLSSPFVTYYGQVSQEDFLEGLSDTDVFVMASSRESFGLSAIDALQTGASLLLSDACGVKDILSVEETDVVSTTATPDELANRIEALWRYPNASRLAASIDYKKYSWDAAAERLHDICMEAVA